MANTILVGAQWGDEGKGKIIDVLTEKADIVVRSQGGANAGHTVRVGDKEYILHLIPSGILRETKICLIGNGVVINPTSLVGELDGLKQKKISVKGRLFISDKAHLVMPYHSELESCAERLKGKNKIGTTLRGIGPAYGDKIARTGLRVADLVDAKRLETRLRDRVREVNRLIKAFGGKSISFKSVYAEYGKAARRLSPFVANTTRMLHEALAAKKEVLAQGAVQVLPKVPDILKPDGEPDQAILDTVGLAIHLVVTCVRHRRGLFNQRFDRTQANCQLKQPSRIHHPLGRIKITSHGETDDASKDAPHLSCGKFMPRVSRKTRIEDIADSRVAGKAAGDFQGRAGLGADA